IRNYMDVKSKQASIDILILSRSCDEIRFFEEIVNSEDVVFHVFKNFKDALHAIVSHRSALLILDVHIPRVDINELCLKIKSDNYNDLKPTVLYVADDDFCFVPVNSIKIEDSHVFKRPL